MDPMDDSRHFEGNPRCREVVEDIVVGGRDDSCRIEEV